MDNRYSHFLISIVVSGVIISCGPQPPEEPLGLDSIAEDYVKLALKVGAYDEDFIDSYFGPESWQPEKRKDSLDALPYEELKWQTIELLTSLEDLDMDDYDSLQMLRFTYLHRQLISVKTKLNMIAGNLLPFDVETRALYDATTPHFGLNYYDSLLQELDSLLPGSGNISDRYEEYSREFIIPQEKLDTVFKTALHEARKRTLANIQLPENEDFKIEYVTNKPWSGYNWYQGNGKSLIQLNTDFPIYIDRAIDLACHEGYPGHHVYNVSLEQYLVKDKGYMEFSIYLLFSPQSLIAEGSANFGIEVAFPGQERLRFEKEILFPLAGIDPEKAETYYKIQEVRNRMSYADNEAAQQYLNRQIKREEAAEWLVKYNLYSWERALQRTRFYDKYRSYVINYNYGRDLVKNYIESQGGVIDNPEKRWELFRRIITTPLTASILE